MPAREEQRKSWLAGLSRRMAAACVPFFGPGLRVSAVFVPLRLHRARPPLGPAAPAAAPTSAGGEIRGLGGVLEHLDGEERDRSAFLLGKAGSGKTTLLAEHCRSLCDRLLEPAAVVGSAAPSAFPVWVPCPSLTAAERSLAALVRSRRIPLAAGEPALLFLDGLDELPHQRQAEVVDTLERLLEDLEGRPGARALVACRSEEVVRIHHLEGLLASYPSYEVVPPDAEERGLLFARLAEQVAPGSEAPTRAAARLESLFRNSGRGDVFETPLLLSLFALVCLEDPDVVPGALDLRRLFDRGLKILLRQRLPSPEDQLTREALEFVAAKLYREGRLRQGSADVFLEEPHLLDLLRQHLPESLDPGRSALDLFAAVKKSGLLVGDYEQLAFVHRSFFEYLLAGRMADEVARGEYGAFAEEPLSQNLLDFLSGGELEARAVLATTRRRSFEEVRFRGGNAIRLLLQSGIEPRDLELCDAVLAGADFRGADLHGLDFGTADLRFADFSYATLDGADWSRVSAIGHLQIEEGGEIRSATFSPKEDLVFFGNALGQVVALRGADLKPLRERDACHDHTVTALALDDRNGWLFTAGYDGRCQMWKTPELEHLASVPRLLPKCRTVTAVSVRLGEAFLACGTTTDEVLVYRAFLPGGGEGRARLVLHAHCPEIAGSPYRSMSWSPEGDWLLVGGFAGAIHWLRFDRERHRLRKVPVSHSETSASVWGASFSGDGRFAAAISDGGVLNLWQMSGEGPLPLPPIPLAGLGVEHGRCLCFGDDGSRVFCGSDEGLVLALDRTSPPEVAWRRKVHGDSVYTLRPIHGGTRLLTSGLDALVTLLDTATGEEATPPYRQPRPPRRLSITGLRVRRDLLEHDDDRYLSRRGAILVDAPARPEGPAAGFEYDVALSYAGPDRTHAEALARRLAALDYRVFYDRDEAARIWGQNLLAELYEVYRRKARFCVVFSSSRYLDSPYTNQELAAANERRTLDRDAGYLLRIQIDDTPLPGLPESVAYVKIGEGIERIAELLARKLSRPAEAENGS